jgi:hypothetical protein
MRRGVLYNTIVDDAVHEKIQEAGKWLYERGYIKAFTKYQITSFALERLVESVERKRAEEEGGFNIRSEKERVIKPSVAIDKKEGT